MVWAHDHHNLHEEDPQLPSMMGSHVLINEPTRNLIQLPTAQTIWYHMLLVPEFKNSVLVAPFNNRNQASCMQLFPTIHAEVSFTTMQFARLKILCFLLLAGVFISFQQCRVQAIISLPQNNTFPAVIVFGDSVVDTGNNNYLPTIAKVNYPPYGKDFIGGKPTGRFSNGKVPSDLLVEELGIKELSPAYLDLNLQPEDLITGVNFASGAAGYDPLTSELALVLSLSKQLEMFQDYVMKLKDIAGEDRTATILSNSLYVLVTGSNDITNTYFSTPLRKSNYDVPSYTDLMLCYGSGFLQDLYRLGARRIGVLGLPPIGCVPSQRTLKGGLERNCVDNYNEMAQLFNSKLSAEINSLNSKYPEARIVYGDIYNILLDLIHNPQKYGFKVSNMGCCGTGKIEVAELCKLACPNASDYVFWDSFHLTEKAYRVLVHQFLEQHINSFL